MTCRKGIILAGGTGSRLYPVTLSVSKQLLPVYDKPMIYYPISVLMQAGIREIAIITTPQDQADFQKLLGDGRQWGLSLTFLVQPRPEGVAQAYLVAERFLDGAPSALVLGDNIFFGPSLPRLLAIADTRQDGGTVFGYKVPDIQRYGALGFDADGQVVQLVEKPTAAPSDYAVTGLYFLDATAPARAKRIEPSARGELEIITLLEGYLLDHSLSVECMDRGFAWMDAGTHDSLLEAGNFVRNLQKQHSLHVGDLEQIARDKGWIETQHSSVLRQRCGSADVPHILRKPQTADRHAIYKAVG